MELARAAAAVCAVTRRAVNSIDGRSALRIAGTWRRIGRRIGIAQSIRLGPAGSNSADDDIDLVVGQHSAGVLRKRRHGGSGNSVGGYAANRGIVGDGEVNRICQVRSQRRPFRPRPWHPAQFLA